MIESPRVSRWKYLYQNQKFSPRLLEIFQTIIEGTIPIESYCCIELNPTQDFTGLYRFVSSFLPTSWFSVGPCSLENSDNFAKFCDLPDSFTVISLKAKRKIWIDVPRTFNVFLNKSTRYSEMINSEEKRSRFLGILCRTLCTSTILLGGWYCQGMAFVAASYILFADNEYLSHRTQNDIIIGTYACGLYHNCSLLKHGLHGLYQWGPVLENYFKEFTHQITVGAMSGRMLKKKKWWHMCKNDNELQSRIGSYFIKAQDSLLHLNDLGYAINYYAVEWFTTSYLLSLQMDICLMIQDILIFGPHASSADILLKVGVAILSSLRDKILALPDLEDAQLEFKKLVFELTIEEIIPIALEIQLQTSHISDCKDEKLISLDYPVNEESILVMLNRRVYDTTPSMSVSDIQSPLFDMQTPTSSENESKSDMQTPTSSRNDSTFSGGDLMTRDVN